ncbi:MAG: hypothetical protein U1D30_13335 [Planctomycetota bacterium]
MNADRREKLIARYLEDPSSEEARRALETACATDPTLRRSVDEIQQVIRFLESLPKESVPDGFAAELLSQLAPSPANSTPPGFAADGDPKTSDADRWKEVLHAYLDDESSADERRNIEQNLERSPAMRREFEEWKRVQALLGSLPMINAPEAFADQLLCNLTSESNTSEGTRSARGEEKGGRRKVESPFPEILTAYLDGELSQRRRNLVEEKLAESSQARRALQEHDKVRKTLGRLPRMVAPQGLLQNTMEKIAAESTAAKREISKERVPFVVSPRPLIRREIPRRSWHAPGVLMTLSSIAAALVLLLSASWRPLWNSINSEDKAPVPAANGNLARSSGSKSRDNGDAAWETNSSTRSHAANPLANPPIPEDAKDPSHPAVDAGPVALDALASLGEEELRDLEQRTIQLWSSDAVKASQRLWIVLNDNQISATEVATAAKDIPSTIEVQLTARQLEEVLDDLVFAERNRPLFVRVGMSSGVQQAIEPALAAAPVDTVFRPIEPLVMPVDDKGRPVPKLPPIPSNPVDKQKSEGDMEKEGKPIPPKNLADRFLVRLQLRSDVEAEQK